MKAIACPICGSTSVQRHGKRYSLYPAGIVAIVGLAFAMLHQVSTPQEYRCDQCGADFARRTTLARIARVFLYVFGIVLGLLVLAAIAAVVVSRLP